MKEALEIKTAMGGGWEGKEINLTLNAKPSMSFYTHNFVNMSIVIIAGTGVPISFDEDCGTIDLFKETCERNLSPGQSRVKIWSSDRRMKIATQ